MEAIVRRLLGGPIPIDPEASRLRRAINLVRTIQARATAVVRAPRALARRAGAGAQTEALGRLRALGARDPAAALRLVARMRALAPGHPFLRRAEALFVARLGGWAASGPALAAASAAPAGAGAALLSPRSLASPLAITPPRPARPAVTPAEATGRVVIYTARFGAAPALPPLFGVPDRVRFLCFADRPEDTRGWRCVETPGGTEALARCKILAAETLAAAAPEAEFSLWLDPDRLAVGNLDTALTRWFDGLDFALWRHAEVADWSDLAERRVVAGDAPPAAIAAQAASCAAEGLPRAAGCFDTGVIWRRHGAPAVTAAMRRWWALDAEAPGADDLSLLRALRPGDPAAPLAPAVMPLGLGPATDNAFFARQIRGPVAAPKAKALAAAPAAPGVRRARVPLTFVYSTKFPNSTTTLLRGKQLSELVAAHWGDLYDVSYVSDMDAVRDQVVLVTKEALWLNRRSRLEALKARNVALIGSWEDGRPEPDKLPLLDALMTLSIRAMLDLNRLWPSVPTFLVTHNVNTAVPFLTPPTDRLRTGYIGDLPNTVRPESLAGAVDLVNADSIGFRAKGISVDWLDALPHYNCHWIVRNLQRTDGWKPFLKGFVAARCGATVIVTRDDQNAVHYLGDDYPFYAASLAPADLEDAWARAASAFGGPEWRFALEIMRQVGERSSDAQVAVEFKAMMDAVLG